MKKLKAFAIIEYGPKMEHPEYPLTGVNLLRVSGILANSTFFSKKHAQKTAVESRAHYKRLGEKVPKIKIVECVITYKE